MLAGLLISFTSGHAQIVVVGTSGDTNAVISTNVFVISGQLPNFRGNAAAAWGFVGGGAVFISDATLLSDIVGAQEASSMETNIGEISLAESHESVVAQESATVSEASVAEVSFMSASSVFGAATTITADLVMSLATASCTTNGPALSGQTQVSGLVINGESVAVTGEANQVVFLPSDGFVVINEQMSGQTTNSADIVVNALHIVVVSTGANVVIGSSSAGITCDVGGAQGPS